MAHSKWNNVASKNDCIKFKCKQEKEVTRERASTGNKKHDENEEHHPSQHGSVPRVAHRPSVPHR
jgi:hypothetical protein